MNPQGMNINGKIVPFRNDAQQYSAYGGQPTTTPILPVKTNNMSLLKDTIKGIPSAAKRLGRDASQMLVGGSLGIHGIRGGAETLGNGVRDFGRALKGQPDTNPQNYLGNTRKIPAYKKGGKIAKTGPALLHKGERVLTKSRTQALEKKKI